MNTFASRIRNYAVVGSLIMASAPSLMAADLVLQRVPFPSADSASKASDVNMALVSYQRAKPKAPRALYVSSGSDVKAASSLIDGQPATTYTFSANDGSPTAVIDLGVNRSVRRVSTMHTPRAGTMHFYVMQSLPGVKGEQSSTETALESLRLNDETVQGMKAVGTSADDGMQGTAAVNLSGTSGRYVMVRWTSAVENTEAFSLAEVGVIGGDNSTLLAQNTDSATIDRETAEMQSSDGKTMLDGKTMIDAKDMPGEGPVEGPQSPGEGPPPSLPQPPPFTFVPVLVPVSP